MRTLQSLSLPLAQAARCPAAPSKLSCWSENHRAQAHLARLAGKVFARCTLPCRTHHLAKRCVASIVALLPLSSRSPRSCPAARHFTGQHHHYIIKFAYLRLASSWCQVCAARLPPSAALPPIQASTAPAIRCSPQDHGAGGRRVPEHGPAGRRAAERVTALQRGHARGPRSGEGPLPRPRVPLAQRSATLGECLKSFMAWNAARRRACAASAWQRYAPPPGSGDRHRATTCGLMDV